MVPWPPTPQRTTFLTFDISATHLSNSFLRADLGADAAAGAGHAVYVRLLRAAVEAQGRAAEAQAALAADAGVVIDGVLGLLRAELGLVLGAALLEGAGVARDDQRGALEGDGLLERLARGLKVHGVHLVYVRHAEGPSPD